MSNLTKTENCVGGGDQRVRLDADTRAFFEGALLAVAACLGLLTCGVALAQFDVSLLVHQYEGGAHETTLTCWRGWWAYGDVDGAGPALLVECHDTVEGLFKDGFEASTPSPATVAALRTGDVP